MSASMRTRAVALAFGATLRAHRTAKNVSQDRLAALCDFDRTYPSLMERGLRSPTLAMVLRLSEALNVEAVAIVADTVARLRDGRPQ